VSNTALGNFHGMSKLQSSPEISITYFLLGDEGLEVGID
jgi:hypothetical protein